MNTSSTRTIEPSERRIRKHVHGKSHTFEIECAPGFIELCKRWCEQLWRVFPAAEKHPDCLAVIKNGRLLIENAPFDFCHDLLLRGRMFTDVKIQIFRGRCSNEEKLLSHLQNIPWELWIPTHENIVWDIRVDSLRSQLYNESRIKTHISEYLGKMAQTTSAQESQQLGLDIHLEREVLSVWLSLGGRHFWQRKTKEHLSHAAPLREDIAACLIARMSEIGNVWGLGGQPQRVLNPFCGTGTLLHEAAIFLSKTENLLDRPNDWAYLKLPFYRKAAFLDREKRILGESRERIADDTTIPVLIGEDLQPECVSITQLWFDSPAVKNFLKIKTEIMCRNSAELLSKNELTMSDRLGWIVSNPPFGIRLSNNAQGGTENLYRKFAQRVAALHTLKRKNEELQCDAWLGFVLCPDETCWRIFQSTLSEWNQKCEHFTLGGLDIRVFYFGISL